MDDLTYNPLDPDDIVTTGLRVEVLQATAEVVVHPLAILTQVGFGLVQELLCDIHQVHGAEEGQQESLSDAAYSSPTVQGNPRTRLSLSLLLAWEP